jgi:hypothetical protein
MKWSIEIKAGRPKSQEVKRPKRGKSSHKKAKRIILNEAGFEPAPEDQSLNLAP